MHCSQHVDCQAFLSMVTPVRMAEVILKYWDAPSSNPAEAQININKKS